MAVLKILLCPNPIGDGRIDQESHSEKASWNIVIFKACCSVLKVIYLPESTSLVSPFGRCTNEMGVGDTIHLSLGSLRC